MQGTAPAPRNTYPAAPPATIKGAQRPAMTSPAGGLAPYRGAGGWTPQGYAPQQTYRFTAPLAQPAYATYATQHTATTTVSGFIS